MYTMQEIEALTGVYAEQRNKLQARLQGLRDEFERVRSERMDDIRVSLGELAAAHDILLEAIKTSPALFAKPKTHVLNGLRVGWMKRKGSLTYACAQRTVALIEQLMPDRAATLIKTEKAPVAATIAKLQPRDLAAIGATLGDDIDAPCIKPVGDELDKLIKALLTKNRDEAAVEEALA